MGVGPSAETKLERDLAASGDRDVAAWGLENFGNTCYCNSVLQSLYFCLPLRRHLLAAVEETAAAGSAAPGKERRGSNNNSGPSASAATPPLVLPENSLIYQLAELYANISNKKKRAGSVAPLEFMRALRERNELFRGNLQQDAHEFFNFILNDMGDTLVDLQKKQQQEKSAAAEEGSAAAAAGGTAATTGAGAGTGGQAGSAAAGGAQHGRHMPYGNGGTTSVGEVPPPKSWIHAIFEGVLTNETKCLCCETVSNRDEPFMDLSLDVAPDSSVSACLRSFSSTETLTRKDKFFCESCNALQEAEKQMKLKRLPPVLVLHLKRFKFVEQVQGFAKLSHRVVFPLELRVPNMTAAAQREADERLYRLFAVVVHIGRGPNHGHYVAVIKSRGKWLLFDDEIVELVDETVLRQCFGVSQAAQAAAGSSGATNTGYLLFYTDAEEAG
ncbi:unnamed protein product [Phaeothamnion confervicola]